MADYRELMGSPTEGFEPDNISATRRVQCKWDERYLVFQELYNQPYPYHSYTDLLCRNISIDPFEAKVMEYAPGDPTIAYYDEAILTCQYELVTGDSSDPENPGGDNPMQMTFFDEAWEESIEFITLDGTEFKWHKFDPKYPVVNPIDSPAIQVHMSDWKLTYYNVRNLPDMDPYMGKVNNAACYSPSLNKNFATQTLLFHPWTLSRAVSTTGAYWTMHLALSYNPKGWNLFPSPHWEKCKTLDPAIPDSSKPFLAMSRKAGEFFLPYPTADFTPILPPPS